MNINSKLNNKEYLQPVIEFVNNTSFIINGYEYKENMQQIKKFYRTMYEVTGGRI